MAKSKGSAYIEELRTILKNDWRGAYRRYPDQTIFALADARVTKAIEKRVEKNATIKEIRSLHYDFFAGLNRLIFEFTATAEGTDLPLPDAILVLMEGGCSVVSVIDPFDPVQPNRSVPPLPKEGEEPFVFLRPSASVDLVFNEQDIDSVQVRISEFFRRMNDGGGCGQAQQSFIETNCEYYTPTLLGKDGIIDNTNDDCGADDIIITA